MIGPFPSHDMHVHSTFSDGAASVLQNVRRAEELGLRRLTLVDHVRSDTDWLPRFVATVEALRPRTSVELLLGIEAKMLRIDGALDLPDSCAGVDAVYIADHQVPGLHGPEHPAAIRDAIAAGRRSPAEAVDAIVSATANAMLRRPGGVLAHLFSVLPKIGLDESWVSDEQIALLVQVARTTGTTVELSERWRCPQARAAQAFAAAGVPVVVSTDSHGIETLGVFSWCRAIWTEVDRVLQGCASAL